MSSALEKANPNDVTHIGVSTLKAGKAEERPNSEEAKRQEKKKHGHNLNLQMLQAAHSQLMHPEENQRVQDCCDWPATQSLAANLLKTTPGGEFNCRRANMIQIQAANNLQV